ncbi:hypothetical protein AO715_05155 [Xanthomonas sp. Mitacek01]|nr:hypothetical protein AO715_05155 [Xanthomonas sp. Mitacek01]
MNFEGLKNRVERAEALVEGRTTQTTDRYRALRVSWREAWTPSRIMIAGVITGFLTGAMEPHRALAKLGKVSKVAGPKSLQLISAVSGLLTSIQATVAAATAEKAAETADDAAQTADAAADNVADKTDGAAGTQAAAAAGAAAAMQVQAGASQQQASAAAATRPATPAAGADARPRADRSRPDPVLSEQPRPAEAATELSESGR